MTTTAAAQLEQLARRIAREADSAPPDVSATLKAQSQIFSAMAERSDSEAELLYETLTPLARLYPAPFEKLLNGATRQRNELGREVLLPAPAARVEATGIHAVCLTISGMISSWTIDAAKLRKEISEAETVTLVLRNCPGGDHDLTQMIYRQLATRETTTEIHGFALSAGLILALSGRQRRIERGAYVSIHPPGASASGTAGWLRICADSLDESKQRLADLFCKRTGQSPEVVAAWLDDKCTYFFDSTDAVKVGLCTEIFDDPPAVPATAAPPQPDPDGDCEALAFALFAGLQEAFEDRTRFQNVLTAFKTLQ